MGQIYVSFINAMEGIMSGFGIMGGPYAIPFRFLFGSSLGLFVVSQIKPSIAFTDDGTPRPFILFDNASDIEATPLPYWLLSVFFGIFLSVFI